MHHNKVALAAIIALATALPAVSHADVAFNVGAVSDYRYRGISQTRLKPALQGGLDYTNGAFYAGAWASQIKWIKDFGGDASVEIDLYGGVKGEVTKELTYDVGVLTYQYPSNKLKPIGGANANTTEVYGALTYGPGTLKYSYALTDTFGNFDSKGSTYVDLSATFDMGGGVMVTPHFGWQRISGPNRGPASYVDGSLSLSKDFKGLVASLTGIVNRKIDGAFYSSPYDGKYLGRATLVAGLKYNF